ncbi:hypothetical protein [Yinghuangia aomiensis]
MGTGFDLSRRIHRPADLLDLIYTIRDGNIDEGIWLEWKSGLDLKAKAGQFHVARAVVGMANRMPETAARFCEGHGYLLVGVERGQVGGIAEVDSIDLGRWVEAYAGDGPRWSPRYIRAESADGSSVDVLVVEVEPPRWGDPIHCFRKMYDYAADGTVFVRRLSETAPAKSREINALSQRLLASRNQLQIGVEVAGGVPLGAVDVGERDLGAWVVRAAADALEPLERAEVREAARAASGGVVDLDADPDFQVRRASRVSRAREVAESSAAVSAAQAAAQELERRKAAVFEQPGVMGWLAGSEPDPRTGAQYRAEVAAYTRELAEALPEAVRVGASWLVAPLELRLSNPTDGHLKLVEVELYVPGEVESVVPEANEAALPEPPRPYGPRLRAATFGSIPVPGGLYMNASVLAAGNASPSYRGPVIRNGGSTTVVFPATDLRAREILDLDPVVLVVYAPAPRVIHAQWKATCTNRDGVVSGTLELPVSQAPGLDLAAILAD